jgi:Zn ribbon nucleic-acid-binding protein
MLKNVLRQKESVDNVKCVKCGKRDATRDDQLCDNCRFALTLENIIAARK